MVTEIPLEQQLLEQIRKLTAQQQQQLLSYARSLSRPRGLSGREMIRLVREVGFPKDDLQRMKDVIEEGCERIDWDGWDLST